ncbi:ATP-dependent RNA helicase DDX1 [Tetranychus urticae]|uniref:ATP-dependent RNA helicase DDX1 n=1 Tax=Tetranychus urticae TaxID=32264 RepID=UPI000356587E|nr:ATP-dependent RNA helicase DDX1 [Tetranychus urticae]
MAAFEEMGILPEIGKAVEEMEWSLPTDIQAEAIPLILGGGDVLMAAETGSGKTGAFCLPVLQIVWETLNDKNKARSSGQSMDKWLLAFKDRSENLVVSNDGLSCQSKDAKQWQGVRANRGIVRDPKVRTNKFYYEVYFKEAGLARVGWALSNGSLDLGTDKIGWGFGGTGKKSNSRNFENYGTTFGDRGDIIGNVLDLDSETISWTKNGEYLGEAFRIPKNLVNQAFYPCVCTKNAMVTVRFEKSTEGKSDAPPNFNWVSKASSSQYINNTNIGTSTDEKTKVSGPRAVIIEPSRELAEQTLKCLDSFKKYLPGDIRLLLIIGGGNAKEQMDQIRQGVDIVVATPGRLEDLVFNNALSLKQCRFFILDEVDGLLQQGHTDIINRLHAQIPRMFDDGRRLQMVVCSATLHNFDVKKLAERVMFFPAWVDLKGEDSVPETVHHVIFRIDPREDDLWKKLKKTIKTDGVHSKDRISPNQPNAETLSEAIKLLKGEYTVKAIDKLKVDQAIIFCRTKLDCDNLESYLNDIGGGQRQNLKYSCVCLHGDRRPQERKTNLEKFKAGEVKFLICTDVAARGIDIKGIPFVIQVTLPDEKANYVHRIGRVGRAERMGLAISLVACVPEKVWFHSNCANRGKNCFNTNLTQDGGCCIWYNELQLLADIEEHLGCTISTIGSDFKLEVNEFDGKVVYGEKRSGGSGINYKTHVDQLASVVKELSNLEGLAQSKFLKISMMKI